MDQPKAPDAPSALGAGRAGGPRDLTTGPIGKTLLLFMLPIMGAQMLQSLNASVNAIWVSHLLGETGLTATANATIIIFFLLGTVFGVTMATSLLVAQAVGGQNMAMVKRVVGTTATFFLIFSTAVSAAGFVFTPAILDAMRTPADARAEAVEYLRVIFLAAPVMMMFGYVQTVQRGAGDSRTPLYFSVLGVMLDIALNPLLIAGFGPFPRLGIAGSALATLIGQMIALAATLFWLRRTKSPLLLRRPEWAYFRMDRTILNSLITRGLPMGAQMLLISGAAIVLFSVVNGYGVLTAAAYGAATVIWNYVQLPGMAVGMAVSAMAAQNVGAKRWDRVESMAFEALKLSVISTAIPVAVIHAFHRPILDLFLPAGSPSIAIALEINNHVLWSFIVFAVTMAFTGVVRATGAVVAPLIILSATMWLVRVPVAAWASRHFGPVAIWWSFPASAICSAALSYLYFRFGGWRRARLMDNPAPARGP